MAEEDMIFGKNRHLFGGLEPSDIKKFNVYLDEYNTVKIEVQLPNDTIINNQTLCSVAGAVIRRRTDNYPKDEFDGVKVADIKTSCIFPDRYAENNGTYYYSVFPYSTQGVYNRNPINRIVYNEPENMVKFEAKSFYDNTNGSTIELTCVVPDQKIVGVIIRKSTTSYPVDENDGELLTEIHTDTVYSDTNVEEGITYYYSAFPYTNTGVYNRNPVNRTSAVAASKPTYGYLYGYDLDTTDSNPATRVSYPSDVNNADFTPAYMNYTTNAFNYGSWPSTPGEKFMPNPCMLKYDGTVDHYLNPNDYTKKTDGTASSVADSSFGGNAMMEWPKIYTKRWEENGIYHFRCCDVKLDENYECWCNYDKNNNEINHFYTAIYLGSDVSSKIRSISGRSNLYNYSLSTEINYATANGEDWYTEVVSDVFLITDLLVMIGKSTDIQTVFGTGDTTGSGTYSTGARNTQGLFFGSNNHSSACKIFGMENWYGYINRRIAGWISNNGIQKIKITRGTKDGSTVTDYNLTSDGYLTIENSIISGKSPGYISECKCTSYGRIPVKLDGSGTTYECDQVYYSNSGIRYALFGGGKSGGYGTGPFSVYLYYTVSATGDYIGSSISCKPSAK